MADAVGLSKDGVACSQDGRAIDNSCCEEECFNRFDPCETADCEDPIFLPCEFECESEIVAWIGCCYVKDPDTDYVSCPPGRDPPKGFECLPEDAVLPNPGSVECVPDCEDDRCHTCFIQATPCPGNDGSLVQLVECKLFDDIEEDCFVFGAGGPGTCAWVHEQGPTYKGCVDFPGQQCIEITSLPNILGQTCCDCTDSPPECDAGNCATLLNQAMFDLLAAGNVGPIPIPVCCCDDDATRDSWQVNAMSVNRVFTCGQCQDCGNIPGLLLRDQVNTTDGGAGQIHCVRELTQYQPNCNTCTQGDGDFSVGEFDGTHHPSPCCPPNGGFDQATACVDGKFIFSHQCESTTITGLIVSCNMLMIAWTREGRNTTAGCGDCTLIGETTSGFYIGTRSMGECSSGCNDANIGMGANSRGFIGPEGREPSGVEKIGALDILAMG
jgi:hypothetical protein